MWGYADDGGCQSDICRILGADLYLWVEAPIKGGVSSSRYVRVEFEVPVRIFEYL